MVHQQSLRKDHRHTDGAPVSVASFLSTDIEGSFPDRVDEPCNEDLESANFGLRASTTFVERDRPVAAPLPEKLVDGA
jgi:hypothetical protein